MESLTEGGAVGAAAIKVSCSGPPHILLGGDVHLTVGRDPTSCRLLHAA